jgi:hypothetical protein
VIYYYLHMKNKIFTLVLLLAFISTPFVASASILTPPFGGTILATQECGCNGGWLMYVFDVSTHSIDKIMFEFGVSRLNGNYNIYTPGVKVLGTYYPGGVCITAASECYLEIPTDGIVTGLTPGIGTSLSSF